MLESSTTTLRLGRFFMPAGRVGLFLGSATLLPASSSTSSIFDPPRRSASLSSPSEPVPTNPNPSPLCRERALRPASRALAGGGPDGGGGFFPFPGLGGFRGTLPDVRSAGGGVPDGGGGFHTDDSRLGGGLNPTPPPGGAGPVGGCRCIRWIRAWCCVAKATSRAVDAPSRFSIE